MVNEQYEGCFFCHVTNPAAVETHHIVPQRMGGSDEPENTVNLCGSCHNKIEVLYNHRFYARLGVDVDDGIQHPEYSNGHTLPAKETKDRMIPPESDHIRVEKLSHGLESGPKYYDGELALPSAHSGTIDASNMPESHSGKSVPTKKVEFPDYYRMHCSYCHTVYDQFEHADMARHLRVHHNIEKPYKMADSSYVKSDIVEPNGGSILFGDRQ